MSVRLGLSILILVSSTASADQDHREARRLREQGVILPFDAIVGRLLAERRGRVLDVALQQNAGGYVYAIEILDPKGVVWDIELDAATGRKLRERREE